MAARERQAPAPRLGTFDRRLLLQGIALGATATAIACSGKSPSRSTAPAQQAGQSGTATAAAKQPKRGGTLSYAGGRAGSSWDTQGLSFEPYVNLPFPAKSFSL